MEQTSSIKTYFAPAERAEPETVKEMRELVENHPLFQAILDSIDGYLMILNPERQVLAMNKQLLKDLKIEVPTCLVGDRPGEILGCIHAAEGPGGCGTSKTCATCGAVISILSCQKEGLPAINECLATVKHGDLTESLEFRVRSTPVVVGKHTFTMLVFHDISGDKRREALERTFFHDILNTVGGLMGWSSLLRGYADSDPKEIAERIVVLSKRLQQEIEDQRRLGQAERGELVVAVDTVPIQSVLDMLKLVFETHQVAKGKQIDIVPAIPEDRITTEISLLIRVLTNMTKNALEAVEEGETVRVWYDRNNGKVKFQVQNPGVMPEEVQLRMFNRSFSTKAEKGRGIGTYSMKLFGERYLGGKVGFESTAKKGTIFYIELPIQGPKK